jgi:sugar/nucleoside kinase (ribokinase family)
MSAPGAAWPLGTVTVLGAHILDVLGWPVETIPPGQGSVRLREIRATAAGTAAGTAVDLAKLGARVLAVGAIGDDLLGDIVIAAMARHGVDTAGLIRKNGAQTSATILPIRPNGERPAFHVPGATRLFTRADIDLERIRDSRALLVGAPDALAGMTGEELAHVAGAARGNGALVAVDVLHPGRPQDFERLAPLLAVTDWFTPNGDQILALTGRTEPADAIKDVLAAGTGGVAVTLGADGCLVAWQGSGAPVKLPALETEVMDTTGCGDGFTAGLLAGLLAGPGPASPDPASPGLASPGLASTAPPDAAWLGLACGALVATGLGSDAGIENMGQVLDFLSRTQPAVAGRIKERIA